MMSCEKATQMMSQAQDRKLSMAERIHLRFHLCLCHGCRNFNGQMHHLRTFTRQFSKPSDTDKR